MRKTLLVSLSVLFFIGCSDSDSVVNNSNVSNNSNQKYPSDKYIKVTDSNMTTFDIVEGLYKANEREGSGKLNYLLIDDNGTLTPYTYDMQSDCATVATKDEANFVFKGKKLTLDANKSQYSVKLDSNTTFSWLYDGNETIEYLKIESKGLDLKFKSIDNKGKLQDFDKNVNISVNKENNSTKVYICK